MLYSPEKCLEATKEAKRPDAGLNCDMKEGKWHSTQKRRTKKWEEHGNTTKRGASRTQTKWTQKVSVLLK